MLQRSWGMLTTCMLVGSLAGCTGDTETTTAEAPPIPQAPPVRNEQGTRQADSQRHTGGSVAKDFAGIRFSIPGDWQEQELPPSVQGFVEAKFTVPTGAGEAELTLTSMGGGLRANLDRWINQVELPPGEAPIEKTIEVDGVEATWMDIRGNFRGRLGDGIQSHSDWGILGVAIPLQPRDFYLKLVGPRAVLADVSEKFRSFVRSAKLTAN